MAGKAHGLRRYAVSALFLGITLWMGGSVAGAPIGIRVVEAESGKPVADAKVNATSGGSNSVPLATTSTSANGMAQITIAAPPAGLRISVTKAGWCPLRWDLTPDDLPTQGTLTFRLTPAVTVGGVARDEAGKPVPGAVITVNFPQNLSGARTPVDDLPVVSDADGKWQADFIAADVESIQVEVSHRSYKWDAQQPSREDLLARKAVLHMRGQHVMAGRVLGPDGRPVAGATVYRGNQYGIMGLGGSTASVTTDAAGHFAFPPGEGGEAQLAAFADGFGPVIGDYNPGADTGPVDLSLTAPHILRVRVTDLEGHPLAGLAVRADGWKSFRYPPWNFTTDADGRFVFTNAPAEQVSMDFHALGRMSMSMYPLKPGEAENIVRLGPTLRLHGRVLDAATGKPVASFSITPGFPHQVFQNGVMTNSGGEFPPYQRDRQFHNGSYDWTFEQPMVMGTEEPYDFMLRAQADGYAPQVSRVFKAREGDAGYDFQLNLPTYLNGVVKLPDGSPAVHAKIYLLNDYWSLNAVNGIPQPRPGGTTMITAAADEQGRFKLMDAGTPPVLIVWHDAGFAMLDTAKLRSSPEITLTGWARIEGTIKRGPAVAANEQVALWYPEQYEDAPQRGAQKPLAFYQYNARADASGHFAFDHVAPGEIAVARVEDVPRPMGFGTPIQDVWGGCRLAVIELAEGASTNLTVGGFGRTVTGRFVSTNRFDSCQVNLGVDHPPVPNYPGLNSEVRKKMARAWFWSDAGAPWRIWFGGTPQSTGGMGMFGQNFTGGSFGMHPWAVKVERDGSFRIDDVPAGDYTVTAVFYRPTQRGDNFAQPIEISRLSRKFSVPAADNLPALPPLDLGEITGTAATRPAAELNLNVPAPTPSEPVKAGIGPSSGKVAAGDSFELEVQVRIAAGYHIYATNAPKSPFTPATLELTLPPGIQADGDWVRPPAVPARDGGMIYTDAVCFRRPLKMRPDAAGDRLLITAKLQYQACNEEMCFPPASIKLETPVTVAGAKTGENP